MRKREGEKEMTAKLKGRPLSRRLRIEIRLRTASPRLASRAPNFVPMTFKGHVEILARYEENEKVVTTSILKWVNVRRCLKLWDYALGK
jgi:hypothetical protein